MICRIENHQIGVVDYLIDGKKNGRDLSREELDTRRIIDGDYQVFSSMNKMMFKEKQLNNNSSSNYSNFVISFTEKDDIKLTDDDKNKIVKEYLEFYTSGYTEDEIIYIAEEHIPKIKYDENGNKRLAHIHLSILKQNMMTGKSLSIRPSNMYTDKLFTTYINRKYNLDNPTDKEHLRENEFSKKDILARYKNDTKEAEHKQTKIAAARKLLQNEFINISSKEELISFLEQEQLSFREVKSKKGSYLRVKFEDVEISLRGKAFENIEKIYNYKSNSKSNSINTMSFEELERRVKEIHQNRIDTFTKRLNYQRTQAVKDEIESQKENIKQNTPVQTQKELKNSFTNIFQNKIYKDIYNTELEKSLKGYFIKQNEDDSVIIMNKKTDIKILDANDTLSMLSNKNVDDNIEMMIETALAKGWKLEEIDIEGDDEFIKKSKAAISQRLKKENAKQAIFIDHKTQEQLNVKSSVFHENLEKVKETNEISKDQKRPGNAKELNDIPADKIIDKAVDLYKIKKEDYEVTELNRIRPVGTKQKGKTNLDFLQKEIKISYVESKEVLNKIIGVDDADIKYRTDEQSDSRVKERTTRIEQATRKSAETLVAAKREYDTSSSNASRAIKNNGNTVQDIIKSIKRDSRDISRTKTRRRSRAERTELRRVIGRAIAKQQQHINSRVQDIKQSRPVVSLLNKEEQKLINDFNKEFENNDSPIANDKKSKELLKKLDNLKEKGVKDNEKEQIIEEVEKVLQVEKVKQRRLK